MRRSSKWTTGAHQGGRYRARVGRIALTACVLAGVVGGAAITTETPAFADAAGSRGQRRRPGLAESCHRGWWLGACGGTAWCWAAAPSGGRCDLAAAGVPGPGHRRLVKRSQAAEFAGLVGSGERRDQVRVRQGDGGYLGGSLLLHQPVLRFRCQRRQGRRYVRRGRTRSAGRIWATRSGRPTSSSTTCNGARTAVRFRRSSTWSGRTRRWAFPPATGCPPRRWCLGSARSCRGCRPGSGSRR